MAAMQGCLHVEQSHGSVPECLNESHRPKCAVEAIYILHISLLCRKNSYVTSLPRQKGEFHWCGPVK